MYPKPSPSETIFAIHDGRGEMVGGSARRFSAQGRDAARVLLIPGEIRFIRAIVETAGTVDAAQRAGSVKTGPSFVMCKALSSW